MAVSLPRLVSATHGRLTHNSPHTGSSSRPHGCGPCTAFNWRSHSTHPPHGFRPSCKKEVEVRNGSPKPHSSATFLNVHWPIAATDFFTVGGCTLRGLVTHYVLFFTDLPSRTVKIAGVTPNPREVRMIQMARNLTDAEEPFLRHTRFLIMDRDTKYTCAAACEGTSYRLTNSVSCANSSPPAMQLRSQSDCAFGHAGVA